MIVLVDKPAGMTSHSVVARIKYALKKHDKNVKVGHTGTLDPMCTGVLPVLIGKYTKLSDILPSDKEYKAGLLLGKTTDTEDITGIVLEEKSCNYSFEDVLKAVNSFKGEIFQTPPMYSAIKVNGQKLYHLARQGIEINREPRKIYIYDINCEETDIKNEYIIYVSCSSGTYIRTLCADIGKTLGCGGCMSSLQRIKANGFGLEDTYSLEEVIRLAEKNDINSISISCEEIFEYVSLAYIADSAIKYYLHGGEIDNKRVEITMKKQTDFYLVYNSNKEFLGLGQFNKNNMFKSIWYN